MKRSIRLKLTLILGIIVASICVSYLIINSVFLEDYYVKSKTDDLFKTYESINKLNGKDEELTLETAYSIYNKCEKYGISLLIIGENEEELIRTGNEMILKRRLAMAFFGADSNEECKLIKETNTYVIQKYLDKGKGNEQFLEIYGFLDNGNRFIMRMAIESIKESISVYNKFFIIISAVITIISLGIMYVIARFFTKPILELADLSEKMANLDFTAKYKGKSQDEIGVLGGRMNNMSEKLETTISELKKANVELQRDIEKKNEIDEMRKEFVSNVSHELKTPIALIIGYAEGLVECVNDDEESRNYYSEIILDEAEKLNKMVKQLLSLNKMEFGNETVEMEHFNLSQVILGVKSNFDLMLSNNSISCETHIDDDIMVWADEFRIEEVLTNYISNAINHCSGEKIIEISSKVSDDGKVRVSVFNSGNNIPEDAIDKVWVKFYKVDKARTREYGGSGIGLSIVKAIMDMHNQKCGVYNVSDGVVFWFELDAN